MSAMKRMKLHEASIPPREEEWRRINEARVKQGLLPARIVTVVEAIHNGMTKNFTYYPADKLEQSADTWTAPYAKPNIKNHDTWEEPLGRVIKQEFVKSSINPDLFTIQLQIEITDPDTIAKVLDGRYKTLSIGGSTNSAVCSICSKDVVKEGFCGHWKGRMYEGKQAFWTIGNMTFDEISWVNVPADTNAQVTIPNLLDEEKGDDNQEHQDPEGGNRLKTGEGVLDTIDNLTGDTVQPTEGAQTPGSPAPQAENEKPAQPQEGSEEPTIAGLQEKIKELEAQVEEGTKQVEDLTKQNESLANEVIELKTKVSELEEENNKSVKQNAELAGFARRALAEHAVNLKIMLGQEKTEDRDTLVVAAAKKSAKDLSSEITEYRDQTPARVVEKVINPGLAQSNDPHASTEGDTEVHERTLEGFADTILKALNR